MAEISEIIWQLKEKNISVINKKIIYEGINSYSFSIYDEKNNKYFLKIFKKNKINKHNRFKSELSFINYLRINNFNNIPNIISYDKAQSWILYKWIDGEVIKTISKFHVEKLLKFLLNINNVKFNSSNIPNASEACFSLDQHKNLIFGRIDNIVNSINKLELKGNITKNYIFEIIQKRCAKINNFFQSNCFENNNIFSDELKRYQRLISPSDVGFHNILQQKDQLYFIDFEYSGIDDPFKLISDLILQPDYSIPIEYLYLLKEFVYDVKTDIPFFEKKLQIFLELYSLKWFCIILNPLSKDFCNKESIKVKSLLDKALNYLRNIDKKKNKFLEILNTTL